MAVLIAYENPMDQYLMRNPGYFFTAEHERAIVDSQNPYILADHLLCAAYELPIDESEVERVFGERAWEVLGVSRRVRPDQLSAANSTGRASIIPPRTSTSARLSKDSYVIVSVEQGGTLLGTADGATAFETVHPGAVYLHAGESYVVTKLDLSEKVAYVEKSEVNYYTTPGSQTRLEVEQEVESKPIGNTIARFGDVTVDNQVTHFWRKQLFTEQTIDKCPARLARNRTQHRGRLDHNSRRT